MARSRAMRPATAIDLAYSTLPDLMVQRRVAQDLTVWRRGEQDVTRRSGEGALYMPRGHDISDEYEDLASRSKTPLLDLPVKIISQSCFVDGFTRGVETRLSAYDDWQRNRMDMRQTPIYSSALEHGQSFVKSLPGRLGFSSDVVPVYTGVPATRGYAVEGDGAEWFGFFVEIERYGEGTLDEGWRVRLYDENFEYHMSTSSAYEDKKTWRFIEAREHGTGVCPVVSYYSRKELDGKISGQVEPFIPIMKRIDQSTFDRLIVQRFGAWKVRYITGIAKPKTPEEGAATKMELRVSDILTLESKDSRAGTFDASEIGPYVDARKSDLQDLAAAAQVSPDRIIGMNSNLSSEALVEYKAGETANIFQHRTNFGESNEQLSRLGGQQRGDRNVADAYDMQVRWRQFDTTRINAAADGLGKLATMVGVPPEMVMERIPDWTQADTDRARSLVESGTVDKMIADLGARGLVDLGAIA